MEVYTIGFEKRKAAEFFGELRRVGIKRLIDVRLKNTSQLAGFTKRDDLGFFLKEICGAEYIHELRLAPTEEIFTAYKKEHGSFEKFEKDFLALMAKRKVEKMLDKNMFKAPTVLLCGEPSAEHCHRRLVLEYLNSKWGGLKIIHL